MTSQLLSRLRRLAHPRRNDERGASAVEYGLLATAIAGVIVAVVFVLGGLAQGMFKTTCDNWKTAAPDTAETCP